LREREEGKTETTERRATERIQIRGERGRQRETERGYR